MSDRNDYLIGKNALIIVIDNPHLCLRRRICQLLRRTVQKLASAKTTVCSNFQCDVGCPEDQRREGVELISILHNKAIEDEAGFMESFKQFENVPLLERIKMPISGLDLFDVAGWDGLLYPYRVSCELDWSGLERLDGPYDLVVILGGSHFNYPMPERILATLRQEDRVAPGCTLVGIPVGPVTGPLSPHWCYACDRVVVGSEKIVAALEKFNQQVNAVIDPALFTGIPELPHRSGGQAGGKFRVLLDWTFIHNWQLKAVLKELVDNDVLQWAEVAITTVSDETVDMLWAKWGSILEDIDPKWVPINSDKYYQTLADADAVVGFVCGRDVWVWRPEGRGVIVCDFAGWWRAFGFEGPAPLARPQRVVSQLKELAADHGEGRR